jgi:polyvinyl alcohol dehydrogenase (cytochrome)
VSVANGVVRAGAMDPKGHVRARDAVTSKILWSFESGGSVASGPAIADGMVFWGSGYECLNSATVYQSVSNNMFYFCAFAGCGKTLTESDESSCWRSTR